MTAPGRPGWHPSANVPGGWQTCPICQGIPAQAAGRWVGGEVDGATLPEASRRLEVVGAPYHDDSTGYSHDCLKRCPVCETCYAWTYTHEYHAGAAREAITLDRLNVFEGHERTRAILEELRELEARFRAAATPHLAALRAPTDATTLRAAAEHLHRGGLQGFDLAFARDALITALAGHPHAGDDCPVGQALMLALADHANRSAQHARELGARLRAAQGPTCAPEVAVLARLCQR